MKNVIRTFTILALSIVLSAGCAQRGEGGDDESTPDAGSGGKRIDPPAESTSWPCRSGVDDDGDTYLEFRPGYLNNGAEASAYIVGQAPGEGIVGYFTGSYVTESKDSESGWYRYYLTGPVGSEWILTYARCEDKTGTNSSCWAQYGSNLPADSAGPYRWNSSGTSYACKGKVGAAGTLAIPHGQ
jgi:hypothetical protein